MVKVLKRLGFIVFWIFLLSFSTFGEEPEFAKEQKVLDDRLWPYVAYIYKENNSTLVEINLYRVDLAYNTNDFIYLTHILYVADSGNIKTGKQEICIYQDDVAFTVTSEDEVLENYTVFTTVEIACKDKELNI